MKKIRSVYRKPLGASPRLVARTGTHCPTNGFWRPEGDKGQPVFVFQGSVMPTVESTAVIWELQEGFFGPPAYPLPGQSRTASAVGS